MIQDRLLILEHADKCSWFRPVPRKRMVSIMGADLSASRQ